MRIAYPNVDPNHHVYAGCGRFKPVPIEAGATSGAACRPDTASVDRLILMAHQYAPELNQGAKRWLTDKSQPHYFSSRFLVLKAETGLATHGILLFRCHRGFGVRFTA